MNAYKIVTKQTFFLLYTHLGYSLDFTVVCHCQVMGGIPPLSGGIVGENQSTRSETSVRSKRVGPLGSNGSPLLGSHSVIFLLVFIIETTKTVMHFGNCRTPFKLSYMYDGQQSQQPTRQSDNSFIGTGAPSYALFLMLPQFLIIKFWRFLNIM